LLHLVASHGVTSSSIDSPWTRSSHLCNAYSSSS